MDLITVALLITVLVVLILILRRISDQKTVEMEDPSVKIESMMRKEFMEFQANLQKGLQDTRKEVSQSKDVISKQSIETLKTIRDLDKSLQVITQQQAKSEELSEKLKDILQTPKLRGNYGEEILEEMLEKVLSPDIWERQYHIVGSEMVDAAVKIKGVVIPIDAKFPRDNYLRYCDEEDENQKKQCWKMYETDVKTHIKSISGKYIKPENGTTDFALMFIPSEAVYYETIADKNYLGKENKIYEFSMQHKVIPVSRNTLYAFLQVLMMGIRNIEIIEATKKIQASLSVLEKDFDKFYKKYEAMGKAMDKAAEAHRVGDGHVVRYKRRLDETLALEELQDDDDPPVLPEPAVEALSEPEEVVDEQEETPVEKKSEDPLDHLFE